MIIVIFSILLIVFLLLAEQHALRNRLHLVRTEYYPEKHLADQGEEFFLCVKIQNNRPRPIPYLRLRTSLPKHLNCLADERIIVRRSYGETELTWSTWMSGKSAVAFSLPIQAERRGQYVLGQLRITDGNFLGNSEESRTDTSFSELVIAPTESEDPDLPSQMGSFLGQISVRRYLYEDPILTVGHRAYTGQEPMKMIDWMQTAKGQGLMVRNYDHTTDAEVLVLLDVGTACDKEDIEECYRIARTVCRILEEKAFSYRLIANARFDLLMTQLARVGSTSASYSSGDSFTTSFGLGEAHFQSILELLGRAQNQRRISLQELLFQTLEQEGREKSIILIAPTAANAEAEMSAFPMLRDHLLLLQPKPVAVPDDAALQNGGVIKGGAGK